MKSQNEKSKENQQAILSELAPEEVREFARAYMTATEEVLAVMERPGEAQNSGQPNAVAWNSTTRLRVAGLD